MTAAGAFAEKAEATGWGVQRNKRTGWRSVSCYTNTERFVFEWTVNEATGNYVFLRGAHIVETRPVTIEEWSNVAAALRIMAEPGHLMFEAGTYTRLPFDPATTPEPAVCAQLEGREIRWRNRITGIVESAIVPFRGRHTVLTCDGGGERVLSFASYEAGVAPHPDSRAGFRAVRLASLVAVGDKQHKPRSTA